MSIRSAVAVVACAGTVAAAQTDIPDRAAGQPVHDESRTGDPALPAPVVVGPAGLVQLGEFLSIQANVDANGNNIVGDAANEPSIAVDPTAPNRIAIGWRQFDTINSNFRQAGYSYSLDGGRTWAGQQIIEPGVFRSDPVLAAAPDGTFYYLSLEVTQQNQFMCDLFISDDAGRTWPTKTFAYGGDKAWIAVDDTESIGAGNLYQPWNVAGNMFFPNQFNRSVDAGLSFEDPIEYDPDGAPAVQPAFGIVDVGPDGEVYVAGGWNGGPPNVLWIVRSDDAKDQGLFPTFDLTTIDLSPGGLALFGGNGSPNPAGLLGQVNVKVDTSGGPTDGYAYVLAGVFGVFPGSPSVDIALLRSTDAGQTWSDPIRVSDVTDDMPSWRWMAAMDVAPNGRIDVVFNDTRNFVPDDAIFDVSETFYTFSEDGGLTWSDDVRISPEWNSYLGWPNQNKIGDYYDIVSDATGAHLIYSTTFNGEQDVYYMRIGDYDCNANGVGDAADIASGDAEDCNDNGIPDSCEIAAGTLADTDGDGIPDPCDCVADCNADGALDILDFVCFQNLFTQGADGADCNDDGTLNILDFVCFQNLFVKGCA